MVAAMHAKKPLWLVLAPVIFLLLWSGGFSVAKFGLKHAEPMGFLALRHASVQVILAPLWAILRPPLPTRRRGSLSVSAGGLHTAYPCAGSCATTADTAPTNNTTGAMPMI